MPVAIQAGEDVIGTSIFLFGFRNKGCITIFVFGGIPISGRRPGEPPLARSAGARDQVAKVRIGGNGGDD
jgi:hypothetical protein